MYAYALIPNTSYISVSEIPLQKVPYATTQTLALRIPHKKAHHVTRNSDEDEQASTNVRNDCSVNSDARRLYSLHNTPASTDMHVKDRPQAISRTRTCVQTSDTYRIPPRRRSTRPQSMYRCAAVGFPAATHFHPTTPSSNKRPGQAACLDSVRSRFSEP